nr:MAG TPA: hypothetical protein [Caudoviricetes sp.]
MVREIILWGIILFTIHRRKKIGQKSIITQLS